MGVLGGLPATLETGRRRAGRGPAHNGPPQPGRPQGRLPVLPALPPPGRQGRRRAVRALLLRGILLQVRGITSWPTKIFQVGLSPASNRIKLVRGCFSSSRFTDTINQPQQYKQDIINLIIF